MTKGFIVGFVSALVILIAGGYLFLVGGGLYGGQDVKPGGLEKWGARSMQHATMRGAGALNCPLQPTDDNLAAGVALYDRHCRVCHGGSDGVASSIAKGLTPQAPQLAKDGVEDDAVGITYWKIAHGIRFTGMPAFRDSLSDQQMWQIALFAAHMSSLPAGAQRAWAAQTAAP
jgi:thiosulfate dehydrogenase